MGAFIGLHGQKRIQNISDLAPWVCMVWRERLKVKLLSMISEIFFKKIEVA
jgi:hypothetical protein